MKKNCARVFGERAWGRLLGCCGLALSGWVAAVVGPGAWAYPPALPHTFYGMIRDEQGNPLGPGASVILETAAGVKVYSSVSSIGAPGVNYRIQVPMDAGLTADTYRPTALNPTTPFRIKVKVGNVTWLPIEMSRQFAQMGDPGKSTPLDLTLGEDANGDGLPDAWQRRINPDLSKVKPEGDNDGDGLSNLQEYAAGTYAFDPQSGFALAIESVDAGRPFLKFMAIRGRSYQIYSSQDMASWTQVPFRLETDPPAALPRDSYIAADVRSLRVSVDPLPNPPSGGAHPRFFRLLIR